MSDTLHVQGLRRGPLHYWDHLVERLEDIESQYPVDGLAEAIRILAADAHCECLLTDSDDNEDNSPFCPHDHPRRTYEVLTNVLSRLYPATEQLESFIIEVSQRAESSRRHWQRRDARTSRAVQKWLLASSEVQDDQTEAATASSNGLGLLDLPPELLSDIAVMAQNDDPEFHLTLSLVSTGFRALTLSTPMLWSSIDIMHPERWTASNLQRSGDTFLKVRMSLPPLFSIRTGRTKLDHFVAQLHPHFHRVRHLQMVYVPKEWVHYAAALIRETSFPNLRSLDAGALWGAVNGSLFPFHSRYLTNTNVWTIQDLCLRHLVIGDLKDLPAMFSWTKLRLVEPSPFPLLTLLDLLRRSPALEYLVIEDWKLDEPADPSEINTGGYTAILPNLGTIELIRSYSRDLVAVAQTISAPNLVSLDLVIDTVLDTDESAWRQEKYSNALARMADAYPHIQRLILSGCVILSEGWAKVFRSLPNLEFIRLVGCMLQEIDLAALVGTSGADVPFACPKLEEVVLENEVELRSSIARSLIACRNRDPAWTGAKIRRVTMNGWPRDNVEQEDAIAIRNWVERFVLGVFPEDGDESGEDKDGDGDGDSEESDSDSLGSVLSDGWASGDKDVVNDVRFVDYTG